MTTAENAKNEQFSPISGLSVVIPVHNEEDNVEPLCQEIETALSSHIPFEVVFVDDASTDQTHARLQALAATRPYFKVVRHKRNAGQSAAVVTGVRAAQYPWVGTLDGDGQNNPQDLLVLLSEVVRQQSQMGTAILCMGRRVKRQDVLLRKLSSRVANGVRSRLLKDNCLDSGCGIKIFNRDFFLRLALFKNCHRFLPALFQRAGAKVISVSVSHRERERGVSKYGVMNRLWVGIVDLLGVAWLMRRPVDVETE